MRGVPLRLIHARTADDPADVWPTDVEVMVGPAAPVLLESSARADLLVVGRHHQRHTVDTCLGAVPAELLRWSRVPVLVVDPAEPPGLRE